MFACSNNKLLFYLHIRRSGLPFHAPSLLKPATSFYEKRQLNPVWELRPKPLLQTFPGVPLPGGDRKIRRVTIPPRTPWCCLSCMFLLDVTSVLLRIRYHRCPAGTTFQNQHSSRV